MGRIKDAFRVRLDPRQIDYYDLRKASEAALKKAGIEPGIYWLPRPYEMPAKPGVNGVWCDVDAGWKTEDILTKGYPTLTDEERAAGVVLLDAWDEVPAEFCPAKVPPGPLLRYVAVRGGRYYHTPFGGLRVTDPRSDAVETHDRVLQGCWLAWMIAQGKAASASETQANVAVSDARNRLNQISMLPGVTAESHVLIIAKQRLADVEAAKLVTRAD
jgi:hypothetical protein